MLLSVSIGSTETIDQRILVLNSYHKGLAWTDSVVQGIENTFAKAGYDAELQIEYMDTKRVSNQIYFEKLSDIYQYKFRSQQPEIVIVSDDHALSFILKYGDRIFPGIPVVFCGINNFQDSLIENHRHITGVVEAFDIAATLKAAIHLQPDTRRIVIINDRTKTGQANITNPLRGLHRSAPLRYMAYGIFTWDKVSLAA